MLSSRILVSALWMAAPFGLLAAETPNSFDTHGHAFQRRGYCGHSLGRSFLDPEPRQAGLIAVGDSEDSGYNAVFGYDINQWLSTEINLAHLGSATIDRVDPGNEQPGIDRISYQLLDLSAVAYLFNLRGGFVSKSGNNGLFCRQSLSAYTRLGYGVMRNEAELDRIDHGRNYESHVTTGLGLEYGFINGLAVRAEYIRFDTDARFASIGLIARFGENRCAQGADFVPVQIDQVQIDPVQIDPVEQFDNYFDVDKDVLSADSKAELTRFADAIRDTDQQVYIAGHADWIGDPDYNFNLSERRVDAVRSFLELQGIDLSRIEFEGFGEEKPIDSNSTAAGRAKNRRVEIRLR